VARSRSRAGGGIVADSEPAFEYAETLHKGEGLRQAIEALLE
jgi:anthranilate/para-aminobenzoate synthase component I